ncbi:MAG TPA: O-antigen ligase family protein [Gemmatimonadaceae bacterium]|nr:O-antigen ligase family protein [Gemmatimonadaceae bacterium]
MNPGRAGVRSASALFAAIILALGVVAVMFASLAFKVFELDRYFVPKELVLNVAAFLVALTLLPRLRAMRFDVADALLAFFIAWSAVSAVFATNHWLAQRALAVTLSSALVFWSARMASAEGLGRPLLGAAALSTILVALTSLAQAYGVKSEHFTLARAPGGTLGNRNFIAHAVAIGFPVTVWWTITARGRVAALLGSIGVGLLAATLVLSRSRAAWLAVAVTSVVFLGLLLLSLRYVDRRQTGGRLARIALTSGLGALLAIVLPNQLNWNSDSPYLDSARKMVDYSSGSGRGRVAQYRNTLQMAAAHPVFGVAPGNWPVRYAKYAPSNDKSLTATGMTANPWPSSDWMAFISERGFVAALVLLGVFGTLFFRSLRRWKDHPDGDTVLLQVMAASTIVAAMITSAFDAVLLLAAPAFLVWLVLGVATGERRSEKEIAVSGRKWMGVGALLFLAAVSVARSATQVVSMSAVGTGGRTAAWVAGSVWDPGSYRINQRVAETYAGRGQCRRAAPFARRAANLFPNSSPARRVMRRCGLRP